ncbi:MAG: LysR family transcriptional regulator [Abitibacteriaceae bacterium]|nr:LysR family transcriptional regulator [Abditibacteriaceae bacterium]
MELYQLKLFVDLAQTGNFTRVATENYVTQAAVTMQIRKLESELGVKLFHRTTRSVTLLEAGQRLLPYAREILQKVEEANIVVRDTKSEISGIVRIAAVHSIGLYELPPYIKTFLKKYPEVKLRIDYRTSEEIYPMLTDGEIDVGVVAYPCEMLRIECIPFLTDRLVLICPEDHPLASRRNIEMKELAGQNFVLFGGDTPTRRATDEVFAKNDVPINVRMECDNIEILKQMVEVGFGVALLPRQSVTRTDRAAGLRTVPLKDVTIERPLGILLLKNAPRFRAVRAFVEILKNSQHASTAKSKADEE